MSSFDVAGNILSSEMLFKIFGLLVDSKTSKQLCVWPPFLRNLPLGGGCGGVAGNGGGLNGSFFRASTLGLPGLVPIPPSVICLIFIGLDSFGEPGAESDPLLCLGGTFGGTITELTFMIDEEENSGNECNDEFEVDSAISALVLNGFQASLLASAVVAFSNI